MIGFYVMIAALIFTPIGGILGYRYLLFSRSDYKNATGNSFFKVVFDTGLIGEFFCYRKLEKWRGYKKILANVYLHKNENGETTEIDVMMITTKGIVVVESKNYSGWIFGNEKQKFWTQSLKGGKKHQFFNPVWQNDLHVRALKAYLELDENAPVFSFIVFSDRCELKKIKMERAIPVLNRFKMMGAIQKQLAPLPEVYAEGEIIKMYGKLKGQSKVSESFKLEHVQAIRKNI